MQAVIMAGGKGTRLSAVTQDRIPKAMVPFCGRPLIDFQIERLAENGIREFIICTGFLGDQIETYLKEHTPENCTLRFVREAEPLGTAGALAYVRDLIRDDFVLTYCDLVFDIDLVRMQAFHKEKRAAASLFAHPNDHPFDSDLLRCDDEGRVLGFAFKNREPEKDFTNLANAGLVIFSPDIFRYISKPEKISLEKDLLLRLITNGEQVRAYRSPEYIKDAGTPERLFEAEADQKSGRIRSRNLKNKQKAIFLDRDGTVNVFDGFITSPDQLRLIPGAAEAIRMINRSEYLAIIVTNQPVVARGDCTLEELQRIHQRLQTMLGREGAYLDDLFFCPHHPDRGFPGEDPHYKIECTCRKPKPGMLLTAAEKYNIDLNASWMIGDTMRDILAGKNAGTQTIQLQGPETEKDIECFRDLSCKNLSDAVKIILNEQGNMSHIG